MSGNATVIFDFDGTLANSIDLIFSLYNEHAEEYGYEPAKKSELTRLRKLGYKNAMKAKGIKFRQVPKIVLTLSREMRERIDEVEPFDGIVDMLKTMQQKGITIGVLTSNRTDIVKGFFKRHNFPQFDFVVSEKTLFGKDKALRKILKRYDLSREQVLYVGDEPRDVTACRKAKIQVIGVTWGLGGKEGYENAPPDKQVDTPKELLRTIIEQAS